MQCYQSLESSLHSKVLYTATVKHDFTLVTLFSAPNDFQELENQIRNRPGGGGLVQHLSCCLRCLHPITHVLGLESWFYSPFQLPANGPLGGNRCWLKWLDLCHPHERPEFSSWIWPGPDLALGGIWELNQQMGDLSDFKIMFL